MGDNIALNFITEEEYNELSDSERQAVFDILNDITGTQIKDNTLYDDLYYADYDEIPVDFETFISDDRYLGKSTRNGTFLYPFWHEEAKKIFSRTDINEIAVTGSIGTGKSTASCLMMAYHLYKTMCLKDPQSFFGLSPGSKIAYAFLNNTLDSSSAVGFDTIQSFLKESPWFLDHGSLHGRGEQEYVPGKGFKFIIGSKPQHTLGQHIICLTGDTLVCTEKGVSSLESLCEESEPVRVWSVNEVGEKVLSDECFVKQTKFTDTLYEIELEDGTIVKCTPEHRFLMKDGSYKRAIDLCEDDEFF